jgi:mevalonate kinase
MRKFTDVYPKLLLLGEYSILAGGNALTLPLPIFRTCFDFLDNSSDNLNSVKSNTILKDYLTFMYNNELIINSIDIQSFDSDIKYGLYLKSDIPSGYGLGSSGTVCAAILKSYPKLNLTSGSSQIEMFRIKSILAEMESFFHGKSSGLDPLASYYNRSIFINGTSIIGSDCVRIPINHWFLLDSDIARNSLSLVETFTNDYNKQNYKRSFNKEYIPYVNDLIDRIVDYSNNTTNNDFHNQSYFYNLLKGLSFLQYKFFEKMIPDNIRTFWELGLKTDLYLLKLLGAGGGGYFLGCTKNKNNTQTFFENHNYKLVWLEL